MTIQDPGDLAKAVQAQEKEADKWTEKGKLLDRLFEKKWSEFGTINGALWEGQKEVEEQTKALVESRAAFAKMAAKAEGLRKELGNVGKLARDMKTELNKSVPKFETLKTDVEKLLALNKSSSLLKDAKKACESQLKELDSLTVRMECAAQDCEGPPKMPDMPALPKA